MGAGDHIGDYLFIGMAQVRRTIDIIDRGSDVKALTHVPSLWRSSAKLATWIGGGGMESRLSGGSSPGWIPTSSSFFNSRLSRNNGVEQEKSHAKSAKGAKGTRI